MERVADMERIKAKIRTIPDYPKPGVMFRDITTLLQSASGFRSTVDGMVRAYAGVRVDKVAGIEARGFILGGAVAHQLSAGFIPIRKQGKLPHQTFAQEYLLEYGVDRVEMHIDAVDEGDNILLVDDLIATGGTAEAAIKLIRRARGKVVGCCFIVDLPDLGGRRRIEEMGVKVLALCDFAGD